MAALRKDVEKILKHVKKQAGWVVFRTSGGHYKIQHEGTTVAMAPFSPSDVRTLKNLTADLRRAGCPGL